MPKDTLNSTMWSNHPLLDNREVSTEHLILHMICLIIQPVREKFKCGYSPQSIIEEDFSTVS